MEKEKFFLEATCSPNWQSSTGMDVQLADLNCSSEQLPTFLNLNWDNSMDQTVPFESALSSIVSSPVASTAPGGPADSVVIRELIGRLGSICNSGEIAPQTQTYIGATNNNSANNSCYSTPLNSPPKLDFSLMDQQIRGNLPIPANTQHTLAPFSADPGFAERAAKYSCFGSQNFGGLELPYRSTANLESGKLSRVSSSQSLKAMSQMLSENKDTDGLEGDMRSGSGSDRKFSRLSRSSTPDDAELNNAREESSVSDQITGGNEINARKRKAVAKGKSKEKDPKVSEENDSNAKRSRQSEGAAADPKDSGKPKSEQNGSQKQSKDNSKPPEPPKDYIHVRARRGQATDSHSLAERVRREKISERMKFLQDLVPGCNKVTGKAVMLDEIINYVQSLQRQVEFLSMKLATVNPRLEFNMEALLSKDVLQSRSSLPQTGFALDSLTSAFPFGHPPPPGPIQNIAANGSETHCSVNPLEASLRRNLGMQLPSLDGFGDASQLTGFWEDDLQSVVQMGFGQNRDLAFPSQTFHGALPTTHMKIEL